ncbi:hypothetical protein IWW35_004872, partial [Coemansia sp. RSA 1878]
MAATATRAAADSEALRAAAELDSESSSSEDSESSEASDSSLDLASEALSESLAESLLETLDSAALVSEFEALGEVLSEKVAAVRWSDTTLPEG